MRMAAVPCTISLLFTSHCVHNRGPKAKETAIRHVAVFLSASFPSHGARHHRSLIRHERNVSSPCKQLFPFVGEISGIFPLSPTRPLSAGLFRFIAPRTRDYLCAPLMESRVSLGGRLFVSIAFGRYVPWKWKLATRCYSRARAHSSLLLRSDDFP